MKQMAKGTISELLVATHYLGKGWVTYTPAHHDTVVDLVALKGPRVKRIQVKTVYDGSGLWRCNLRNQYNPEEVDVIAAIIPKRQRVFLIPVEDIEGYGSLTFGRTNGSPSKTTTAFDCLRYEV